MSFLWPLDFWPMQTAGCQGVVDAIAAGHRRIVLTAPTGTGKSRMMIALIEWATAEWWRSVLYTHRRLLFTQTSGVLTKHGIEHGLRAAGHPLALLRDTQLCMIQSEANAVLKHKRRELHPAVIVLSDELHAQGGYSLQTIHNMHYAMGASIIGVTATPIDLEGEWDTMVVAGRTSDGRRCGALVPAYTYCPDVPDMRHIKKYKVGEDLTDKENHKAIMRPGIFGRVFSNYNKINPTKRPTILFGPDVAGSIYFAEQFHKAGVRAAHIDAKNIWLDGEYQESSDATRAVILDMFRAGDISVLCNRFVLREGIDLPEVGHCIMACVFGSLRTYLQAGGRAIRAHPSLDHVTIQDHGANYIRHGSLNSDYAWSLGLSGRVITGMREDSMRENPELEPIICPRCGQARLSGPVCFPSPPGCGYAYHKRSRLVVQIDGTLRPVEGPSFKPHRVKHEPDTADKWRAMYYRARSEKWDATFNQAEALFFREHHYYPPRDLPLMPKLAADRWERVADVPATRLH